MDFNTRFPGPYKAARLAENFQWYVSDANEACIVTCGMHEYGAAVAYNIANALNGATASPRRVPNRWDRDLPKLVEAVELYPPNIGVLSTGEQCAVALIIDKESLPHADPAYTSPTTLRPAGYTWLDCVNRLEPELLAACIRVQRERGS